MSTSSACALFRKCLADDSGEEWGTFVERFGWQVRNIMRLRALRYGWPLIESDLEDWVQELYCRLLTPRERAFYGRTDTELWAFLGAVCRNLLADQLRITMAQKRLPPNHQISLEKSVAATVPLRSPSPDPEANLLGRERRRRFFERCLEIVRCDRVVWEMRALRMALLEGWTSHEIAQQLQHRLSAMQVDLLVHKLRRHLAKDGIELPRRGRRVVPVPT